MRALIVFLVLFIALFVASAAQVGAQAQEFEYGYRLGYQLGFAQVAHEAGPGVGTPTTPEFVNEAGWIEQRTTTGAMFWHPDFPAQWVSDDNLDHVAVVPGRGLVTWTGESFRPPPVVAAVPRGRSLQVRLTYYTLQGRMRNNEFVHHGAAACSSNIPMGSRVTFPGGETVVCKDTGWLGSTGWVDVWQGQALTRRYGDYAIVTIH